GLPGDRDGRRRRLHGPFWSLRSREQSARAPGRGVPGCRLPRRPADPGHNADEIRAGAATARGARPQGQRSAGRPLDLTTFRIRPRSDRSLMIAHPMPPRNLFPPKVTTDAFFHDLRKLVALLTENLRIERILIVVDSNYVERTGGQPLQLSIC